MSDDLNVNKISGKQKDRAEHIKDKLEKKGMGQDHAEDEALHRVVAGQGESTGGGNSAGDTPKHSNQERDHRLGSAKQSHSG